MLLEKLALITSLIGVAALLFLSQQLEPRMVKISEVNENLLGADVRVQGYIYEERDTGGVLIYSLRDNNSSITVIAYKNKQALALDEKRVEVIGRVREFHDRIEIEADSIKIL